MDSKVDPAWAKTLSGFDLGKLERLFYQARDGDREDLDLLMSELQRVFYRLCKNRTSGRRWGKDGASDLDDLVQECLLKTIRFFKSLSSGVEFERFLLNLATLVKNCYLGQFKKPREKQEHVEIEKSPVLSTAAIPNNVERLVLGKELCRHMMSLSQEESKALYQRFILGYKYREMSSAGFGKISHAQHIVNIAIAGLRERMGLLPKVDSTKAEMASLHKIKVC